MSCGHMCAQPLSRGGRDPTRSLGRAPGGQEGSLAGLPPAMGVSWAPYTAVPAAWESM